MLPAFLSPLLLIGTAFSLGAVLRIRSRLLWAQAVTLMAFALLVLTFHIANLLHALNRLEIILIIQSLLFGASIAVWWRQQKPPLFPNLLLPFEKPAWNDLPYLVILLGVMLSVGFAAVLAYTVPPNNNDALSIHLARVGMWRQLGTYFPWETAVVWQLTFPVNAQLATLWTILLSGSDHFVAFIPWLAGLTGALGVMALARELGFCRIAALTAGLVWLSLPVVQLHLSSVRHDLVSTALLISGVLYFYRWGKEPHQRVWMILSALAIGLVVGTNFSVIFYLPALTGLFLLAWIFSRTHSLKMLIQWTGTALLFFLLLSSPIYWSNWAHFGSPLGSRAEAMTGQTVLKQVSLPQYLALNTTRWLYQMVDTAGLPQPLWGYGIKAKAWLAHTLAGSWNDVIEGTTATYSGHVFSWRRVYLLQEDEAWFGPLGALLMLPGSVWAFWKGWKQRQLLLLAPFLFLLSALVFGTLFRPGWTPYDGRYFMPVSALALALLPFVLENSPGRALWRWLVAAVVLSSLWMCATQNPTREVLGERTLWNTSRTFQLTRQAYLTLPMLDLADRSIPLNAVVGIATQKGFYFEYGLFGEHFTRRLIPVYPPERIGDEPWLRDQGIQYLLIEVSETYPTAIAPSYRYLDSRGDWVVYRYQP